MANPVEDWYPQHWSPGDSVCLWTLWAFAKMCMNYGISQNWVSSRPTSTSWEDDLKTSVFFTYKTEMIIPTSLFLLELCEVTYTKMLSVSLNKCNSLPPFITAREVQAMEIYHPTSNDCYPKTQSYTSNKSWCPASPSGTPRPLYIIRIMGASFPKFHVLVSIPLLLMLLCSSFLIGYPGTNCGQCHHLNLL